MIRRLLRAVFLLLDGLLLILFVVGYSARYLSSGDLWWAELVATGLPYLSLLLLGATVLVWLTRRWKLVAVHLVLVALAVLRFVPLEGGAEPSPDDLVLLTFNTSRGGGARADEQGRAITNLVRAEKPDVAAFQEAFVEYHPTAPRIRPSEPLATLIDSMAYRTIRPSGSQGAVFTPLAVLAHEAHFELIEQTQFILPRKTEDERETRILRTHFRWKGREAVHYNLHLQSFGSRKPWEDEQRSPWSPSFWLTYLRQYRAAYRVQAREVDQIQTMLDRETLPLIISGDFNSTPHNSAFYKLAVGMQDAFKKAGHGWGATYHVKRPLVRIDHVLAGPAWQVVSAHVSEAAYSDHRPLIVRLRWRE